MHHLILAFFILHFGSEKNKLICLSKMFCTPCFVNRFLVVFFPSCTQYCGRSSRRRLSVRAPLHRLVAPPVQPAGRWLGSKDTPPPLPDTSPAWPGQNNLDTLGMSCTNKRLLCSLRLAEGGEGQWAGVHVSKPFSFLRCEELWVIYILQSVSGRWRRGSKLRGRRWMGRTWGRTRLTTLSLKVSRCSPAHLRPSFRRRVLKLYSHVLLSFKFTSLFIINFAMSNVCVNLIRSNSQSASVHSSG